MIIYDYHKDWRRISSLFFIMVAAVDIGSACLEIGRGSISFLDGPVYKDASLDFSGLEPVWYTLLRYFYIFCPCANGCEDHQHNASILLSE